MARITNQPHLPYQFSELATFKDSYSTRAWISVPNPNSCPFLATATADKTAQIFSLRDFSLHSVLEGGHSRSVRNLAWKPVHQKTDPITLVTGSFDATIGIWRYKGHQRDTSQERPVGGETARTSENGLAVEITSSNKRDSLLNHGKNGDDWEFAIVLEGHDAEIKDVAYSPSGQYLASCGRDKSVWIWEEIGADGDDEFETVAVLQDHTADVKCVSWRKDDGAGEVLASAGYDDTIRLWRDPDGEGDWECVGLLEGHTGTIWALEWEPDFSISKFQSDVDAQDQDQDQKRVPRLMSASADRTIRLWSNVTSPTSINRPSYYDSTIPSTMRPGPIMERWEITAVLPQIHRLAIYSISWSQKTGQVLSTGNDGKIVLYEESFVGHKAGGDGVESKWTVLAILGSGHGPYEINHVAWCGRWDHGRQGEEEMVVTTGDDGRVKVWIIEDYQSRDKEDDEAV